MNLAGPSWSGLFRSRAGMTAATDVRFIFASWTVLKVPVCRTSVFAMRSVAVVTALLLTTVSPAFAGCSGAYFSADHEIWIRNYGPEVPSDALIEPLAGKPGETVKCGFEPTGKLTAVIACGDDNWQAVTFAKPDAGGEPAEVTFQGVTYTRVCN
jgi:hypothetical protein